MKREEAYQYVCKHGRCHGDAPEEARYSVRYPPTSSVSIFSDDTHKLVERVFKKSKGKAANGKYIKPSDIKKC